MPSKLPEMRIRLPLKVHNWIKSEAEKNASSMSNEVVRALVGHKERVEKDRARKTIARREEASA